VKELLKEKLTILLGQGVLGKRKDGLSLGKKKRSSSGDLFFSFGGAEIQIPTGKMANKELLVGLGNGRGSDSLKLGW